MKKPNYDIPLGTFRLARAVNIKDPDILQTTSGFNCAVVTCIRYKRCNSRISKVCYSSTQCGLSTSLTNEFRTEWPPEGSLFSHDDPTGYRTKKSLVSVCFVNVRGSGSKLIVVPSSHFHDLLASFRDASRDGAADRRVRSTREAAVVISRGGSDGLITEKKCLNS